MILRLITGTILCFATACSNPAQHNVLVSQQYASTSCLIKEHFEKVSIIDLVSTPSRYHRRRIQVEGYYTVGPERSSIAAGKNAPENESVWVDFTKCRLMLISDTGALLNYAQEIKFHQSKILIKGVFDYPKKDYYDDFHGAVDSVTSIIVYEEK